MKVLWEVWPRTIVLTLRSESVAQIARLTYSHVHKQPQEHLENIPILTVSEEFQIIDKIEFVETIAVGNRIREIARLKKAYGRWRKMKGIALVSFPDGTIQSVEVHWYEARGIGQEEAQN